MIFHNHLIINVHHKYISFSKYGTKVLVLFETIAQNDYLCAKIKI